MWKGIIFFLVQAVSLIVAFVLILALLDDDAERTLIVTLTFLVEIMLLATVWLFAVSKYRLRWMALGLWRGPGWKGVGLAAAAVFTGILVQGSYLAILEALGVDVERATSSTFLDEEGLTLILLSLLAVLVAPLAEEIFFRGFVYQGLMGRYGFWKGAAVSSAIFALAHVEPIKIFPLFVLGILLVWVYHVTGSLWSSVLAHFLNNAVALLVVFIQLEV